MASKDRLYDLKTGFTPDCNYCPDKAKFCYTRTHESYKVIMFLCKGHRDQIGIKVPPEGIWSKELPDENFVCPCGDKKP